MGYYINPPNGADKIDWLLQHGSIVLPEQEAAKIRDFDYTSDYLPVCLVDNGAFTAAAIGFSKAETALFLQPDRRPKVWFIVPRLHLVPYLR